LVTHGGWWGAILTICFLREIIMTIKGLISKVQEEKPNSFTNTKLLAFINEIETDVAEQLNEEHEAYTQVDDTELLAPAPYDRLYVSYLKSQIDYANEEYASYQLNAEQHNQDFADYINWLVRDSIVEDYEHTKRFRNAF
jgi:hypothetical protein